MTGCQSDVIERTRARLMLWACLTRFSGNPNLMHDVHVRWIAPCPHLMEVIDREILGANAKAHTQEG